MLVLAVYKLQGAPWYTYTNSTPTAALLDFTSRHAQNYLSSYRAVHSAKLKYNMALLTKPKTDRSKLSKRYLQVGSIVNAGYQENGTVYKILGDTISIRYNAPHWPFPIFDQHVHKDQVTVIDNAPAHLAPQYEEAPF